MQTEHEISVNESTCSNCTALEQRVADLERNREDLEQRLRCQAASILSGIREHERRTEAAIEIVKDIDLRLKNALLGA